MEETKEFRLPKNVKQIGQATTGQKVYMEDYVVTYLKQMLEEEKELKVSILYGHKEIIEDELYWFVSGAIEAEADFFMERTVVNEESWEKVNELAGRFFQDMAVLGWAIAGPQTADDMQEQIIQTQKTFFRQDQKLFFEYITDEKQENLYLFEKGKMKLQTGYYIYYDRNECMQNYMVSIRTADRHPEEFEADRAIQQIRESREEKKQQKRHRRTTTLLTCFSMILVTTIMIIGITMLNNYEKMQSMEKVLYQISGKIDQADNIEEAGGYGQDAANNTQTAAQEAMAAANVQASLNDQILLAEETQTFGTENESGQAGEQQAGEAQAVTLSDDKQTGEDQIRDGQTEAGQSASEETAHEQAQGTADTAADTANAAGAANALNAAGTVDKEADTANKAADATSAETTKTANTTSTEASDAADGTTAAANSGETIRQKPQTTYVIQKGDTLVSICMQFYGNASNIDEICSLNGIEDKNSIFYGQKIYLP